MSSFINRVNITLKSDQSISKIKELKIQSENSRHLDVICGKRNDHPSFPPAYRANKALSRHAKHEKEGNVLNENL